MKRIDSSNKVVDLFGPGKHGFGKGLPESGIRATYFTPEWCNDVQEELCTVIEKAGIVPDGSARISYGWRFKACSMAIFRGIWTKPTRTRSTAVRGIDIGWMRSMG